MNIDTTFFKNKKKEVQFVIENIAIGLNLQFLLNLDDNSKYHLLDKVYGFCKEKLELKIMKYFRWQYNSNRALTSLEKPRCVSRTFALLALHISSGGRTQQLDRGASK